VTIQARDSTRYRRPMKRALLLVAVVTIAACGDGATTEDTEATTGTSGVELTAAEREWCSFSDSGEDSAHRFDVIFQEGLAAGLAMDSVNAEAAALADQYMADGLSADEATRRVSEVLLTDGTFATACKYAYGN